MLLHAIILQMYYSFMLTVKLREIKININVVMAWSSLLVQQSVNKHCMIAIHRNANDHATNAVGIHISFTWMDYSILIYLGIFNFLLSIKFNSILIW